MYIKFLILKGLKSFRDETVIGPLVPGQNVIIGRNGSGKSNCLLAIQLIFSQRYHSIDKSTRTAILYNTGMKAIEGFVEVIIDNSDRVFPIEKDEFSVKRIFSLKSDAFYIDGKKAISTDEVKKLMEAAGLSVENPYNIVRQGEIQHLATCNKNERLNIVKKIAGTVVYDARKKVMSENIDRVKAKLGLTEANLETAQNHLKTLEQESKVYREYHNLIDRKKYLKWLIHSQSLEKLRQKERDLKNDLKVSKDAEELRKTKMQLQEKKNATYELELELEKLKVGYQETVEQKEKEGMAYDTLQHKMENTQLRFQDITQSQDLKGEIERLEAERAIKKSELSKLREEALNLKLQVECQSLEYEKIIEKEKWIREKSINRKKFNSEEERKHWIDNKLEQERNILKHDQLNMQEVQNKFEEKNREVKLIENDLVKKKDEEKDINLRMEQIKKDELQMITSQDEMKKAFSDLEENLRKMKLKGHAFREEISEKLSKIGKVGTKIHNLMQGRYSLEKVLSDCEELRNGYHGMLVDLIEFEDIVQIPIIEVAGTKLFYHVVESANLANKLIQECKRRKLAGEFIFIPMDKVLRRKVPMPESYDDCALLLNTLAYKEEVFTAVQFVFGGWLICKDLVSAKEIRQRYHGFDLITLEGDKNEKKGVLSGGFIRNNMLTHYLNYRSKILELETLKQKLEQETEKFSSAEKKKLEKESQLEKMKNLLSRQCDKAERIQSEVRIKEKDLINHNEEFKILESACQKKKADVEKARSRISELEHEASSEFCQGMLPEETRILETLVKKIEEEKNLYNAKMKEYMKVCHQINIAENYIKFTLNPHITDLVSTQKNVESSMEERALLEKENCKLKKKVNTTLKSLKELTKKEKSESEEISIRQNQKKDFEDEVKIMKTRRDKLTQKCKEHEEELSRLENRIEAEIGKRGAAGKEIEEYKRLNGSQLAKELKTVEKKLKTEAMMTVNTTSPFGFEKLKEDINGISHCKEKLTEELESTTQTIGLLEEKKNEQIRYTFRQVQKYFSHFFQKLVPAGEGTIQWGDKNDPSDVESCTGVGFQVSFNKEKTKMKELKVLSGGQKTVVSLAFIFSIQKCDPVHFYLFDEVDAALDADRRQFAANLIKKKSATAQFILTTFRPELVYQADKCFMVKMLGTSSCVQEIDNDQAIHFIQEQIEM